MNNRKIGKLIKMKKQDAIKCAYNKGVNDSLNYFRFRMSRDYGNFLDNQIKYFKNEIEKEVNKMIEELKNNIRLA